MTVLFGLSGLCGNFTIRFNSALISLSWGLAELGNNEDIQAGEKATNGPALVHTIGSFSPCAFIARSFNTSAIKTWL